MVLSRLDLAIVAVLAGGLFWIEQEHRIIIATPAAAEVSSPAGSACPDNDSVPFSADCIAFIEGGVSAGERAAGGAPAALPAVSRRVESRVASCPNNENAPYSASCIRFLSGWYWQPNPPENAP
jgi:hypothetical protein